MILYLLAKLACLAVCMAYLTPMKYPAKKSALYIAAFQSLIFIGNSALYFFVGQRVFDAISLFTIAVPGFFCFNAVSKYKGFKVLFSLLTVIAFGMFSSFVGFLCDIYIKNTVLFYALKFLSFLLIIVYVAKVLRIPYLKLMHTLQRGWGPLSLIPFLLINALSLLQYYPTPLTGRPENIVPVALVFIITFAFYTLVYANFRNIMEYFELKRNREVLSLQAQMYKSQYDAMLDNQESARIFRHDLRHHLGAINAFLADGNTAEARKYIRKLDGSLSDGILVKYCDNYGVNAVLSSLISRAAGEGIRVECEADIPEDIPIDSMELGLVFANALDNAINACRAVADPADRKIRVECREHCGQLYIRVSNPYAGCVRFDGEFPVSGEAEHGVGTRSIAAIAEKHGGVFSFAADTGVFKTSVTLRIPRHAFDQ